MDDFKQLETILEDIVTDMNGNNFLLDLDTSLFGLTEEELTKDYPNEKISVNNNGQEKNFLDINFDQLSDLETLNDLLSTPKDFMDQYCRAETLDRPTALPLSPLDCQGPVDYFALSPLIANLEKTNDNKETDSVGSKRSLDDLTDEYNFNLAKKPCVSSNVVNNNFVSGVQANAINVDNQNFINSIPKPRVNFCQRANYVRGICSPLQGELARKRLKEFYLSDDANSSVMPKSDKLVIEKSPSVVLQYRPDDSKSEKSLKGIEQQDGEPKKTIGEKFATIRALLSQQSSNVVAKTLKKQNTTINNKITTNTNTTTTTMTSIDINNNNNNAKVVESQHVKVQSNIPGNLTSDQSNLQAELESIANTTDTCSNAESGENLSQILSEVEIPPDNEDEDPVLVQIIMEPNNPRVVGISRCRKNVLVNTRLTREEIMKRFETYFEGHPLPLIPYVPTYSEWGAWKMGQYNLPNYKCVWKALTTMTQEHFEQFVKLSSQDEVAIKKCAERPPVSIVQYLLTLDRRIAMLQTAFLQLEDGDVKKVIPEIITKAYQEYLDCKKKNFPAEYIDRNVY